MEESTETGKMEFPQDVMLEDCFSDMSPVSFGFVTNVTLVNETACVVDVECTANGTAIHNNATTTTGTPIHNNSMATTNTTLAETEEDSLTERAQHDFRNNLIDDIMADIPESKCFKYDAFFCKIVIKFSIITEL